MMSLRSIADAEYQNVRDSTIKRLAIFEHIHALGDKVDQKERNSSQSSDASYQDLMEQTLGSSNDLTTEGEDFSEVIENIQLELSLGEIPIVD